jgi:hypothetical protein
MVRMSGETQVIVGIVVTAMGLLVVLIGWLVVRRRLQHEARESVTVVTGHTTRAAWWKQAELEFKWNEVNEYWVAVLPGKVDEQVAAETSRDVPAGAGLVEIRVPKRVYLRVRPGSLLEVVSNDLGNYAHPYYRVNRWIWGFGTTAIILLVNGVSLFFMHEAFMPSWLQ